MRMLREAGFLDETPVRVGGVEVKPRALTEALLHRAWALPEGDDDFTVLRVEVAGTKVGKKRRIVWDLYDLRDAKTRYTSMARTTGFPCAIVVRLVAQGAWTRAGVHPPETLRAETSASRPTILEELA